MQKKAIRLICNVKYNSATEGLFEDTGVLRFDKLYDYMLLKLMYRHSVWSLPLPLQAIFQTHSDIHHHDTRNRLSPRFNAYVGGLTENSFLI